MIHSSEFQGVGPSERLFCLARSYLVGSIILCEAMIERRYDQNFSNSRVLLHLLHHAFELFFKGSLLKKGRRLPGHHNLSDLYYQYHACFQDSEAVFSMPFGLNDTSSFRMPTEYFKTLDQHYRYSIDKSLAPHLDVEGFLPETFYEQLQDHCREFNRLIPLIIASGPDAPLR